MPPEPRSLARSFLTLSGGQVLARLVSFGVTVRLSRVLLPEGFGSIALGMAVLAYGGAVVEMGFETLGPLEVARARVPLGRLAGFVVALRLLLALLGYAGLAAFALWAPLPEAARGVILIFGFALAGSALDLGWVFQGRERMRPVAAAEVAQQLLMAVGVLVLVGGPEHLWRVPLVYVGSRTLCALSLLALFRGDYGPLRVRLDRELLRELLPASLTLSGSVVVGTLLQNADLVLIGVLFGTRAAGLYGAAYRIVWVPTLLAMAYVVALRPLLGRASLGGLASIAPLLRRSTRLAATLGVGVAVGGSLLAADLLRLLFGPGYVEAASALGILLAAFALQVVSRPYRALLVAFGHQAADLRIMLVAAGFNLLLNVLLVPRYGLSGAAWVMLLTEALILAASQSASRRRVGALTLGGGLLGSLACASLMGGLLAALGAQHVVLRVLVGGVAYVVLLLATGVLRPDDLRPGAWRA